MIGCYRPQAGGEAASGRATIPFFAQHQNIPFALFGLCVVFCFFLKESQTIIQRELHSLDILRFVDES